MLRIFLCKKISINNLVQKFELRVVPGGARLFNSVPA